MALQQTNALGWDDDPLWYKDAIIYQLHVKAFADGNNDGIGDFPGLTAKLDYLQDLGVNTVWLLPFYPSPLRDDGYDIADYRNVDSDYGTRRDFRNFVREAHKRGLKIITELVINHTSDQHPWFQAARRAPKGSAKRNFYVWHDDDRKFPETRIIFADAETSNWTWDPVARQYYWHRFFSHQPDLNHNNLQVVKAVIRLMRFWLDMGVDGLRLDAIPYLCVREGTRNENLPETHAVLKRMRTVIDAQYRNRLLLAEANQWPEDVSAYFGDGDECHMAYHFPLMPRLYTAVAQEDRHPIVEILRQTPEIPETCQWAIFLRNHDELTLERVTDRERDYLYRTYAADRRINAGIRRRLAPLLDNELDKIKLMNGLLLSMPGSPAIYYGDEIGMGDNLYLGDRNGVRTPMQWSPDRNAGFSKADPQRLYLPLIMDPIYGFEAVNVEAQSRDPASLLNWMKRLIAVRKNQPALGRGSLRLLRPGNRKILVYVREHRDDVILCVANLARSAQPVELDLTYYKGRVPVELLGRTSFPPVGDLPYLLTLPGHSFYWFSLALDAEAPTWHDQRLPPVERPVLVLFTSWNSFFPDRVEATRKSLARKLRQQLAKDALPEFLPSQSWFTAKGERIERVTLKDQMLWEAEEQESSWLLTQFEVQLASAEPQRYFVPLAIAWEADSKEHIRNLGHAVLAKVRQQAQVGSLYDAFADPRFCQALVDAMGRQQQIPLASGDQLAFSATGAFAELVNEAPREPRRPTTEGSHTTVILGDHLFLKGYRRLQSGLNPELEIGRFLTDVSPFANISRLAGALEYQAADGTTTTLALLQTYVANQGDAWTYTLGYLERFLEVCLLQPPQQSPEREDRQHGAYLVMVGTLGRRTAQLHRALAVDTDDPAFRPEPVTAEEVPGWCEQTQAEAAVTLDKLERSLAALALAARADAERLLAARTALLDSIASMPADVQVLKTRYHGNYHLGHVLVAEDDFVIIDFEGEPARTHAERRAKHSPLKDVAGLLRSFNRVTHAALDAATAERPDDRMRLEPFAWDWERQAAAAFLTSYAEAAAGCPVYPPEPTHARALIGLFTLEKTLYELRYELDHRPDRVRVPLQWLLGFCQIVEAND